MFADDTTILSQSSEIDTAVNQLQESINIVTKWFNKWKLELNALKSESKIFTLRRLSNPPKVHINNQEIQWNDSDKAIKYLGVHLDKRLTWGFHINRKINEAHTRLTKLYPIINKKSPLKIECGKIIYTSIIRPILTYGSSVWSNASDSQINKIQTFQNKVLRIILNAPWFIRNSLIHRELQIPHIKEYIRKLYKRYHEKLHLCPATARYSLGRRNIHQRLKRKLPQDILLSTSDSE